jgi:hypothetical protein
MPGATGLLRSEAEISATPFVSSKHLAKGSAVKRDRKIVIFGSVTEGYAVTEVRAGLNATLDSSLQRVSDIVRSQAVVLDEYFI